MAYQSSKLIRWSDKKDRPRNSFKTLENSKDKRKWSSSIITEALFTVKVLQESSINLANSWIKQIKICYGGGLSVYPIW